MRSHKVRVTDVLLLALGVLLLAGTLTFLSPCGPKEDGSWMTCHWAGNAVAGVAGALLALAVVRLFVSGGAKLGLDVGTAALAALAALLPGRLIDLCMTAGMRCRAVMTPGVTVLAALTLAAAAADILLRRRWDKA